MFIARVMITLPEQKQLRAALNSGVDTPVGEYLYQMCYFKLTPDYILNKVRMPPGTKERQIAQRILKCRELYAEWRRLYIKEWRQTKQKN